MAVPKRFNHDPSYAEFFHNCLLPNVPGVLPCTAFVEKQWPAYKCLVDEALKSNVSDSGRLHPAFDWLSKQFGSQKVPVVSQSANHDEGKEEVQELTVSDAVDLMRESISGGTVHYIKDWHLFLRLEQSSRSAADLYAVHPCFQDDWMNHPLLINPSSPDEGNKVARTDDFRFCYAGQKGTQTHLHADVYTSYSWSTNLVGRKRWRMFPPDVSHFLRRFPPSSKGVAYGKELQEARTSQLARNVDTMDVGEHGKGWSRYQEARAQMIEFDQEPGETVFVPSNWYHEVLNLDDCISINHNWCNSVNLPSMFAAMEDEVEDVEQSLDDVKQMIQMRYKGKEGEETAWRREWTETVQEVVEQDMGWAWRGFWKMVEVNLQPVADPSARPERDFVHPRVSDLVTRFVERSDFSYLDEATLASVRACQQLLRS